MSIAVPGFEVVESIGFGGFSRVYRATQSDLGRDVALKVLTIDNETAAQRTAFERECRAMGALAHHPSIVSVFTSTFTADGRPCIVMEYFGSGTLGDRLQRDGVLDIASVLRAGVELAGALQTAHDHGVVHRDIKPSNLFVSGFGTAVLGDFGISSFEDERTLTGGGGLTVHYAPPELIEGEPATAASDVYSLAASLYTLASGDKPYPRGPGQTTADLARRILIESVPSLVVAGAPSSLVQLLRRAMAKDPVDRPATAGDFGRRLQQIQTELGYAVTPLVALGYDDATSSLDERVRATPGTSPTAVTTTHSSTGPSAARFRSTLGNRRITAAALGCFVVIALGSVAVAVAGSGADDVGRAVPVSASASTGADVDQFFATPPVPQAVLVEAGTGKEITVSWTQDATQPVVGYQVERVGSAEVIETTDARVVVDAGVGSSWCFVVRAVGEGGRLSSDTEPVCLEQR